MEKQVIKRIELARLAALYRLGVLPDAELKRLETWMTQSPGNRQLFEQLSRKEIALDKPENTTENAWKDFTRRYRVQPKRKITRRGMIYTATACCAVVLLAIGTTMFYSRKTGDNVSVPKPCNTVQLVLENGNAIRITPDNTSTVEQVTGVALAKSGKEIDYTSIKSSQVNESPAYHTIIVPKYGEYTVRLSDNSIVKLNSESTLKYPITFNEQNREVWLEGEAYFEVTRDTTKRFIVHVFETAVTVLGTTFNVMASKANRETATTLVSGSVSVNNAIESRIISPGEQAVTKGDSSRITVKKVDTNVVTAWVRDMFYFDEQSLGEIMETLARWYEFEVVFEQENLKQRRFTLEVSRYDTIDKVLDLLEETRVVRCRKEGNTIYMRS